MGLLHARARAASAGPNARKKRGEKGGADWVKKGEDQVRGPSSGCQGAKASKGFAEGRTQRSHTAALPPGVAFPQQRNVVVSNPARQGVGPNCRPLSGGNFPALPARYHSKGFSFRVRSRPPPPPPPVQQSRAYGHDACCWLAWPQDEDEEHRRKMAEKRPFSSAVAPRYTFDVREHAPTPAGTIYRRDGRCLPPRADGSERLSRKQRTERRLAGLPEKPFRPANPTKSGSQGCVGAEGSGHPVASLSDPLGHSLLRGLLPMPPQYFEQVSRVHS